MNELKLSRLKKNLQQNEMASLLGINASTYAQYENGVRSIPDDIAEKIVSILEVEEKDIFLPKRFTIRELKTR